MNRTYRGFTLVELLVVIAIIGVLVALLLPAVQAAREAARRSQCANNFKQVGLAQHNYNSAKKRFPPGDLHVIASHWPPGGAGSTCGSMPLIVAPNKVGNYPNGYGWSVFILPYLEEETVYDQFDFALQHSTGSNFKVCAIPIKVYNCPDNPQSGTMVHTTGAAVSNGPDPRDDQQHTSMCAVTDSVDHVCGFPTHRKYGSANSNSSITAITEYSDSAFGNLEGARPAQISDGLSKTLFVGEVLGGGPGTYHGHFWTTHNLLDTADGINGASTVVGGAWPFVNSNGSNNNCRDTGFASLHPGGCHFVFGDGHVSFLSENIAQNALEALTTRAGNESESEPQ
jgi:prepilin-type N-terminal cleavage/methylation domain-containing protein/prepilin-type processing-associated H-X9-DG protein